MLSSLFLTKDNSTCLCPIDEPLRLPSPFNINFGAFFVGMLYLFLTVSHCHLHYLNDILPNNLVRLDYKKYFHSCSLLNF